MNYLEYFHFDNSPFPVNEHFNYFYPRSIQSHIVESISKYCRFYSGIYLIVGTTGCGKSTLLSLLASKLSNNDCVIEINATTSTDILKTIATFLNLKNHKNIDDILTSLHHIYIHGQNIILIIDDAHLLSKEQLISLNSLTDVAKYLRVVLCANQSIIKKLSPKSVSPIRTKIIKRYKLKYFSYIEGVHYISYISKKALALSQHTRPIGFFAMLFLSFISNRNINNINIVSTAALRLAFSEKTPYVTFSQSFRVAKEHFSLVRTNIYQKFQKIFAGVLVLFTLFFAVKIIIDRYDTITTLEARQSVARQERNLHS